MEVFYAADGVAALEQAERICPISFITDMQMPNLDGVGLAEDLKAQCPLISVILMTAAGSEAVAIKALQVGAASSEPPPRRPRKLWKLPLKTAIFPKQSRCSPF